ncbi:hypothetical protein PR048_018992 [Dryococelus australis]|uniref:Uncharacterized protein n=1 Tax=Dryococelus australis TaxID=614101 RepID=A0ABQ9H281_9NEOP|nr:hypothetical protein PR048_018992 [Dryococelus australis]
MEDHARVSLGKHSYDDSSNLEDKTGTDMLPLPTVYGLGSQHYDFPARRDSAHGNFGRRPAYRPDPDRKQTSAMVAEEKVKEKEICDRGMFPKDQSWPLPTPSCENPFRAVSPARVYSISDEPIVHSTLELVGKLSTLAHYTTAPVPMSVKKACSLAAGPRFNPERPRPYYSCTQHDLLQRNRIVNTPSGRGRPHCLSPPTTEGKTTPVCIHPLELLPECFVKIIARMRNTATPLPSPQPLQPPGLDNGHITLTGTTHCTPLKYTALLNVENKPSWSLQYLIWNYFPSIATNFTGRMSLGAPVKVDAALTDVPRSEGENPQHRHRHRRGRSGAGVRIFAPPDSRMLIVLDDAAGRSAGFLGDLPSPGPFAFRHCSVLTSLHRHRRGRSGAGVRILAPPDSRMLIVLDDAAGRRVFSGISPPATFAFRHCSVLTSLHRHRRGRSGAGVRILAPPDSRMLIVLDDAAGRRVFSGISRPPPPPLHSGIAPYSPRFNSIESQDLGAKKRQQPSSPLHASTTAKLPWFPVKNRQAFAGVRIVLWPPNDGPGDNAGIKGRGGGTEDPRENPPTNCIVRHDSHVRKSGVTRPGIKTRSAMLGGEQANRSATVAPMAQAATNYKIVDIWATLDIEILRVDEGGVRRVWSSAGMQGRRKREIPEKTRRPAASSGTIRRCESAGVTPPGIEPGSPWWEASSLTKTPQRTFVDGSLSGARLQYVSTVANFRGKMAIRSFLQGIISHEEHFQGDELLERVSRSPPAEFPPPKVSNVT